MSTATCLIVQPIHRKGFEALSSGGVTPRLASASDMQTVAHEIAGCAAVITRNAGLSGSAIAAAPLLKVIGVHGIGTDLVDRETAARRGVAVVNTPTANVQSVAEHAIGLLFSLAKRIVPADRAARSGDFDFKYEARMTELSGLTFGIIGFGRIGQATARLAGALGMRTLAFSPTRPDADLMALGAQRAPTIDDLLKRSDVVSLHLPLTPSTRDLIAARELKLMKRTAFLINTGRGGVVSEPALIEALRDERIAGAGLDVFASEEMPPDYELLRLPNVVLTPHVAGSTEQCLERTALTVAADVLAVLEGRRPVHPVPWSAGRDRTGRGGT